jgi:tetratricopeptide (TPR) repeat protein
MSPNAFKIASRTKYTDTLSIFGLFKQKVLQVRKSVEEFKDNHKMTSEAISLVVDSMPEPFNKFLSMIWNGLEKEGEDSSVKLLEILEKIENNTEQSFYEIKTNISELIQFGAKTEDIQILGEQIRISTESVTKNLKEAFNEELKKAAERLEESFENSLTELRLLESNLRLVTSLTKFNRGSRDCWKLGYFRDEDIKNGYDARRPVTDEIISSIDNNIGTILYGKPYYGKSVILKRIMFEHIDKGYAVVFADGTQANAALLIRLLDNVIGKFPKVLVIADNVHRRGSEALFEGFNYFADKKSENIIKFFFGAREEEFKTAKEALERKKAAEIDVALRRIHEIRIDFNLEDAELFLKQAFVVSKQIEISKNEAIKMSADLYDFSKRDPFIFVFSMIYEIFSEEKSHMNFIERDFNEKITSLGEDERLWKAALFCTFMGMFDISIVIPVLSSNGIYINPHLKSLVTRNFLYQNGDEYITRHERWALEFILYLFNKKFDNDFVSFDAMYKIKDIINSILNGIDINNHLDILNQCDLLYRQESSRPLIKMVVDNYIIPENLRNYTDIWTGKGNILDNMGRHYEAIKCFDKATEIDSSNDLAWYNKGLCLVNLKEYDEAIRCLDRVLSRDSNNYYAWNVKGRISVELGKHDEAMKLFDTVLEINPNYVLAWYNKGNLFSYVQKKYDKAIKCYDKAIDIDPKYVDAWQNKGVSLTAQKKYAEAMESYNKVINIDPNNIDAWYNKGHSFYNLGLLHEAIMCFERCLEINPNFNKALTALDNL